MLVGITDAQGNTCQKDVAITINGPGTFGNLLLNLACPTCTVGGPIVIPGNTYFGATQAAADALALAAGNALLATTCVPLGGPTEIGALVWTVAFCCGATSGSMAGGSGSYSLPAFSGNNDVTFDASWCSPWPDYDITIQISYNTQPDGSFIQIQDGYGITVSGTLDPSGSFTLVGTIRTGYGLNSIHMQFISVNPSSGTITITPLVH